MYKGIIYSTSQAPHWGFHYYAANTNTKITFWSQILSLNMNPTENATTQVRYKIMRKKDQL